MAIGLKRGFLWLLCLVGVLAVGTMLISVSRAITLQRSVQTLRQQVAALRAKKALLQSVWLKAEAEFENPKVLQSDLAAEEHFIKP